MLLLIFFPRRYSAAEQELGLCQIGQGDPSLSDELTLNP